jgi:adsorption protein B
MGYLLVLYVVSRMAIGFVIHRPWGVEHVVGPSRILAWLLFFNLLGVVWRGAMKAYFVGRLSGMVHAVLSTPRLLLGNIISISAAARALSQYLQHVIRGNPLRWLKTTHSFLDADKAPGRPWRIGDAASRPLADAMSSRRSFDEEHEQEENCGSHGDAAGGGEAFPGGA